MAIYLNFAFSGPRFYYIAILKVHGKPKTIRMTVIIHEEQLRH